MARQVTRPTFLRWLQTAPNSLVAFTALLGAAALDVPLRRIVPDAGLAARMVFRVVVFTILLVTLSYVRYWRIYRGAIPEVPRP